MYIFYVYIPLDRDGILKPWYLLEIASATHPYKENKAEEF